jgi:hypothetical protein
MASTNVHTNQAGREQPLGMRRANGRSWRHRVHELPPPFPCVEGQSVHTGNSPWSHPNYIGLNREYTIILLSTMQARPSAAAASGARLSACLASTIVLELSRPTLCLRRNPADRIRNLSRFRRCPRAPVEPRHSNNSVRDVSRVLKERPMDTTTLLVIVLILMVLGGGFYGRGRWF